MATAEQKAASRQVMDAVRILNCALTNAGSEGLFVELQETNGFGARNPNYVVSKIETRETVLP
jgi:hypothetical protein